MQLHDAQGKRLYLTADERLAFMAAAARAARPVRTLCAVLHTTGCRISEALALTPEHVDLPGKAVVFETLKKRRRGVYRAVPVPPGLLDQLDLVHGLREALKRGRGHAERPLWPCSRMTAVVKSQRASLSCWWVGLQAGVSSPRQRARGWAGDSHAAPSTKCTQKGISSSSWSAMLDGRPCPPPPGPDRPRSDGAGRGAGEL